MPSKMRCDRVLHYKTGGIHSSSSCYPSIWESLSCSKDLGDAANKASKQSTQPTFACPPKEWIGRWAWPIRLMATACQEGKTWSYLSVIAQRSSWVISCHPWALGKGYQSFWSTNRNKPATVWTQLSSNCSNFPVEILHPCCSCFEPHCVRLVNGSSCLSGTCFSMGTLG